MATLAVYGDANDNSEEGTTEMDAEHDPRETFRQALDQAGAAVAGMKPEQLGDRTPCSEFDVATLANHLIGAVLRAGSIARGVPVTGMLAVSDAEPAEGWVAAYESARQAAIDAWKDDSLLAKEFVLPWATLPGAGIVEMYGLEATLHSWDLAVATGQEHLLDDDLAAALMPIASKMLPPEHRGGEIPFAEVVPAPAGARTADQLAAFTGRRRP